MTATTRTASGRRRRRSISSSATREAICGAGADAHARDVAARGPTTATESATDRKASGAAGPSCSRAARATSRASPPLPTPCRRTSRTLTPMQYRNPGQLETGGVLVVGASATGTQLADEIHRSGRPVTLSRRRAHPRAAHSIAARTSSGGWTKPACSTSATIEVDDIVQGAPRAVAPAHRLARARDARPECAHRERREARRPARRHPRRQGAVLRSLRNQCALSDLKLGRLLDTIDQWATANGLDGEVEPPHRLEPTRVDDVAAARPRSRPAAKSAPSSGRRASGPTTPGSRCRCSIAKG